MSPAKRADYTQPFFFVGDQRPGHRHGVLLIHGFTGTPANVRLLGDRLHAAGFTVQGPMLPGHGTRLEDMRTYGGHKPWRDTVLAAYDELAKTCDTVSVGGLSMGGVLSLILAEQRTPIACFPMAAPMRLIDRSAYFAPLIAPFRPFARAQVQKPRGEDFLTEYDTGYPGTPICRVGDLLRLMCEAERHLSRVSCPLLVVQSHADETVRPDSAQIIYDKAGSQDKRLLWFTRSGHVCTIGPDREQLCAEVTAFLRGILGDTAPDPAPLEKCLPD